MRRSTAGLVVAGVLPRHCTLTVSSLINPLISLPRIIPANRAGAVGVASWAGPEDRGSFRETHRLPTGLAVGRLWGRQQAAEPLVPVPAQRLYLWVDPAVLVGGGKEPAQVGDQVGGSRHGEALAYPIGD